MALEHPADDTPSEIVQRSGWGDLSCAAEKERGVDEFDGGFGEHARPVIDEDGGDEAGEPEPVEIRVEGTRREDALGPDEAPDDGGVEENTAVGAGEAVGLVLGANVFNGVGE